jgi:hypothetical protein
MHLNTFNSKPSAWFETKVFSFFSLIFSQFLLIGCGSNGGGNNNGTENSTLSSSKELTNFSFDSDVVKDFEIIKKDVDTTIDYHSNNLIPTVTHTGINYSPAGAINFSNIPATYTITAEGSTTEDYSVIV